MHVIPQSWSHLHILVSLIPSVGLLFALGFYIAAFATKNDAIKRTSLVTFGVIGLLAIPTYFSGIYSMEALSDSPKISKTILEAHDGWGVWTLGMLVVTGIVAWVELLRSRSTGRLSIDALHLVLGLACVTLALMAVVNELGWQVNHNEFRIDAAAQKTPQAWSHAHTIVNHLPTIGLVFALAYYIAGIAFKNVAMKRNSLVLFVMCAILVVPTFITGSASMWALTDPGVPGISRAVINAHRDMAVYTLFAIAATGVAAWIELWRFRQLGSFSNRSLYVVLALAIITLGMMAETGHRGGQINHPEIVSASDVLPTDPQAGMSPAVEILINQVIWLDRKSVV
jgi:uncharacterized membrane protein